MTEKRKRQTPLPVQSRLTGETVARNQVKRHLGKALAAREVTRGETPVPSLWLAVEASPFVLHALVRSDAELSDLDRFLRDVWMECCGHLSQFESRVKDERPVQYVIEPDEVDATAFLAEFPPEWREEIGRRLLSHTPVEKSLATPVSEAFSAGRTLTYEYDMGTTTACTLKVVAEVDAPWPAKKKVRLLARNERPAWVCRDCGEPATQLCTLRDCGDGDGAAMFCARHAKTHPKKAHPDEGGDDWMMAKLSNSPRDPSCGYEEGPRDEEPYVWP